MSEERAIARGGPFSRLSIAGDLRSLGLREGATVLVHSSLSQLGYVAGGPQAGVAALLDTVGPAGTVVMPAHSSVVRSFPVGELARADGPVASHPRRNARL